MHSSNMRRGPRVHRKDGATMVSTESLGRLDVHAMDKLMRSCAQSTGMHIPVKTKEHIKHV
jgi:hypothetical protein